MKKFWLLFASAFALLTLAACSDDEDEIAPEPVPGTEPTEEYDEAYYAEHATVSSEDAHFTLTDEGGEIAFKVEGGEVVLTVDCGVEWTAAVEYLDEEDGWLDTVVDCDAGTLTVTADANTVEAVKTAAVTVMTAESGIEFATISVEQNAYGACEITVSTNEWNVPAAGELTTEIAVEANADWEVENTADWLTAEKTDTGLKLTAEENDTTEERTAEVVLTCTDGVSTDSETITVTQEGRAACTLTVETNEWNVPASGDELTTEIAVEANADWEFENTAEWLTAEKTDTGLKLTAEENNTIEVRVTEVVLTCTDGVSSASETITVTQDRISADYMILTYKVTEDNLQVVLPLSSANGTSGYIDWGDGKTSSTISANQSHTYTEPGEYDIILTPKWKTFNMSAEKAAACKDMFLGVKQWGTPYLTSMSHAFYNCKNVVYMAEPDEGTFASVTTFEYAFQNCTWLTELPEGFFDGCGNVTAFNYLFYGCSALTKFPDLSKCTAATTFANAFQNCTALTEIPEGMFASCTKVTNFVNAFNGDTGLTGESPYDMVDGVKVHLYERGNYPDVYSTVSSSTSCFSNCKGLSDYDSIPKAWGGGGD